MHLIPPSTLRFHALLKHPAGGIWPALVSLVTHGANDTLLGIHRTYLTRDGMAKAPVDPQKMSLGRCRGGAVRLSPPGARLIVGEGLETCLSVWKATGIPTWAALSTGGMRGLVLPALPVAAEIIIASDNDTPGREAAHACACLWRKNGRTVRIALPPHGKDFNDTLRGAP